MAARNSDEVIKHTMRFYKGDELFSYLEQIPKQSIKIMLRHFVLIGWNQYSGRYGSPVTGESTAPIPGYTPNNTTKHNPPVMFKGEEVDIGVTSLFAKKND